MAAGISLTLILPSAYVALPGAQSSHGSQANSWTGLRIASAGPWHNLVIYAALAAVSSSGLNGHGRLWAIGGYGLWQDVGGQGPTVVGLMAVSEVSSLTDDY